ncbi:MAG: AraC family transcriptional regulator [Oleiphilaceae bacterium]|nr:AraC family transcriptional regulator [Oleiphilaceae bacterium]
MVKSDLNDAAWYRDRYVSSSVIRALYTYLQQQTEETHPALLALGLSDHELNDSGFRYRAPLYFELMDLGERLLNDASFGFHYGQCAEANRWGVMGYILSVSDNLREVIATQLKLQALVGNIGCTVVHEEGERRAIEWYTDGLPNRHVAEEALTGWICFARRIVKAELRPLEIHFRHEQHGLGAEYESFFACPVKFGQAMNAVIFDDSLFQTPLKQPDRHMFELLQNHAGAMLQESGDDNLKQQLRAYLIRELPREVPTIDRIATKFQTSVRTLQRRFESWGTNYKQFVDLTRKELALHYLSSGGENLLELTFMLGFSEQSAFQRAFKRWTGKSPRKYRAEVMR